MTAIVRTVINPEKPLIAEPTNITYRGNLRYKTASIIIVCSRLPITGKISAGFLRPDLSVHAPQNGANRRDGIVLKNVSMRSIRVDKLCTYDNERILLSILLDLV